VGANNPHRFLNMAIKPKPEIRKLKRARYEAEHREAPRRDLAEVKRTEAKFLKVANDHIAECKAMADHDIDEYSRDAASYVRNRAFGAISIIPCLSPDFVKGYNRIDWGKNGKKAKGLVKIGG
jgi:hypothetical protein